MNLLHVLPVRKNPAEALIAAFESVRKQTFLLVRDIQTEDLDRVHSPLMSPLAWDLGHIAAFEDLWLVHRYGGEAMVRPELAQTYDAFETPRAHRGKLQFLRSEAVFDYLAQVRERSLAVLAKEGEKNHFFVELVLRHEQQHTETMLQTISLAQLLYYKPEEYTTPPKASHSSDSSSFIEFSSEAFPLGSKSDIFAYDNEQPEHLVHLQPFAISRVPVTNKAYLDFVQNGGYTCREYWSETGWEWLKEEKHSAPLNWSPDWQQEWRIGGWEPLNLAAPVMHVSWFEAEAFARAHSCRLPTETEWELAATWDPTHNKTRLYPWGDTQPTARHANLDQLAFGPADVGSYLDGQSPSGCLGMIGDTWEWTASEFHSYPGFQPNPYREYSEVFFQKGYKVLRGGSWATRSGVITSTFRNWDFPQRRQIFAGFRLAKDI